MNLKIKIYKNLDVQDLDGEIWKDIEEFKKYQISNFGRVKSFKLKDVKILKQCKKCEYLFVNLWKNKKPERNYIHILMYKTFIEKIPEGYIIHHKDFTKDNFLDNFQLMTKSEHSRLHKKGKIVLEKTKELMRGKNNPMFGIKRCGELGPFHKLIKQDIIEIRKLCCEGILTQKEIGKLFGVNNRRTISSIKNNKSWKNI